MGKSVHRKPWEKPMKTMKTRGYMGLSTVTLKQKLITNDDAFNMVSQKLGEIRG